MASFLLIVSGHPAAGKSTLSTRLARDLQLPLVNRDRLRRYVFGELFELPTARDLIPAACDRVVLGILSTILGAGGGVVLDGNFNTERHMRPIRDYAAENGLRAVECCLWGDPEALERRFIERADPPLTSDLRPYFDQVVRRPRESVLFPPAIVEHLDHHGPIGHRCCVQRLRAVAEQELHSPLWPVYWDRAALRFSRPHRGRRE